MRVLNAGLDPVEFKYNFNTRNDKQGGHYVVPPGEQIEVPEDAKDLIHGVHNGPGMYGLVILEFDDDLVAKQREGLERYLKTYEKLQRNEHQRANELKAVGVELFTESEAAALARENVKRAKAALRELADGNTIGDAKPGKRQPGRSRRRSAPAVVGQPA